MNQSNTPSIPHLRGEAFRNMRLARGMSLDTLATKVGVSKQSIHAWELGRAHPKGDNLTNLYKALSVSETVHNAEITRLAAEAGTELKIVSPPWHDRFNDDLVALDIKDEDMSPYVEQGEVVYYEIDRAPKRLEGCVLVLSTGQTLVRRYEKRSDGHIFVSLLNPEKTEQYLWSDVVGLHRIALRGS